MHVLIALLHLGSGLLIVAGTAKILAPSGTARALKAAGLPAATLLVRLLGATEVAVGIAAIAVGGWILPAAVAAFYASFTGFVAVQLRSGTEAGCGCFGGASTPLTRGHLVFDGVATLAAVLFVIDPAPGLREVLGDQPWAGAPYLLVVTLGVALEVAVLTVLPTTRAARRPPATTTLRFGPVVR